MKDFVLKDELCHAAYSWPATVLTYTFQGPAPKDDDILLCNGAPVCFQIQETDGGYTLKILSDLPTGGERKFSRSKGKRPDSPLSAGGNDYADNGILRLDRGRNKTLFSVAAKNGAKVFYTVKTDLEILSRKDEIYGGSIEKELCGEIVFSGGAKYSYKAEIKKDLDYIGFYEEMTGFDNEEATLEVTWENFDPCFRHTLDRGKEKIDSYLKDGGEFPFVINPYVARASAWDQRYVSYSRTDGFWVGFLLHDLKNYDDGKYAVWASDYALALTPYADKISAPIKNGKRAFMTVLCSDKPPEALGSTYLRYYSMVSLDNVKDYVLRWDDDKTAYPKHFLAESDKLCDYWYFKRKGTPDPKDMTDILDNFCTVFREFEKTEPVSCRAFMYAWAPVFDMTASRLKDEDFDRVRAAMAFTCYTLASEDYCPVDNMLAGHPNFLTDIVGTLGLFAALLGENHPMHKTWLFRYETALARNFKYHIRPDIEERGALGGRWTENTGCYMFAMLHATVFACYGVYKLTGGEMPMLYPHFTALLKFLVNMQLPENEDGRRLYPPQGSHSCTGEFGGRFGHGFSETMILLAEMCKNYEPLLSEYILYNYRNDFDAVIADAPAYESGYLKELKNTGGTPPELYSCKYTGLGYVLRHAVGTDDESMLILQQIDEGPNYRWGRAAQGGCGELYYYANRKKYTDHAPEDVGDENRGDVQSCTNFGVLVNHEFRSVGRGELTEPFMDFSFAKYARVNAGDYSAPYYKYRAVMAVENKYFAVYDAVGDKTQYGRFAWAQKSGGEFPSIWNVKPAVEGRFVESGAPTEVSLYNTGKGEQFGTQVKAFDGRGDFLTLVSHLRHFGNEPLIKAPKKTNYGAEISFPARKDNVFFDAARIEYNGADCVFDGYAGFASEKESGEILLAVFDGRYIGKGGCFLEIPHSKDIRHGMSLRFSDGIAEGDAAFGSGGVVSVKLPEVSDDAKVFVDGKSVEFTRSADGFVFEMPAGAHKYVIGKNKKPEKPVIRYAEAVKGGFTAVLSDTGDGKEYAVEISSDARNFVGIGRTENARFTASGLKDGKYYVRADGSAVYPVYVNSEKPHAPEGLRVTATGNGGFLATWGAVLGASRYKLYKKNKSGFTLVYEGEDRSAAVKDGEYRVSAVNGNGEGGKSLARSATDPLAHWDNRPDKGFVRDTRSNEHGYPGFDYVNNPYKKQLEYPN